MVSIIIPSCCKTTKWLKPALDSIVKYTSLDRIELLISANGISEQVKEFLIEYKKTPGLDMKILFHPERVGYPKAVNDACHISRGDKLVFFNSDCQILPSPINQWIDLLERPFLDNENTGITGPLEIYCKFTNEPFLCAFLIMVSRKMLSKIGLLDLAFKSGHGEDVDLSERAKLHGFTTKLTSENIGEDASVMRGNFPAYHEAEISTEKDPEVNVYFRPQALKNQQLLKQRKASGYYSLPFKFPSTIPFISNYKDKIFKLV